MALRVAYVLGTFPSLTETFILREMLALREMGVRLTPFALRRGRTAHAPEAARRWAADLHSPCPWRGLRVAARQPRRAASFLCAIRRLPGSRARERHLRHAFSGWSWTPAMRRLGIQAIHAHFAGLPTWSAWAAAHLLDLPLSFSAHAWDLEFDTELLSLQLAAARFAVTCNAFNRDRLRERYPEAAGTVRLLYHGLESEWFRPAVRVPLPTLLPDVPPAAAEPVLLAVGRLLPKKGFHLLLQAAGRLAHQGIPFRLLLVGDGPLQNALERQAARPPLRGRAHLAGARSPDAMRAFYAAADLLVQPSIITPSGDRDGLPNVVLEAMASGLPVVASRVAALPEAIEEGITGYLAPPGDPVALADTLGRALAERSRWPALGEAARRVAQERFRLERNVAVLKGWLESGGRLT